MPATITDRDGRPVSSDRVREALAVADPAPIATRRKAITERLGLAETATDAEIFGAVDAMKARADQASAEDLLYELAFGKDAAARPSSVDPNNLAALAGWD